MPAIVFTLFIHFLAINYVAAQSNTVEPTTIETVEVRSKMNKSGDRLLVYVTLPETAEVSFTLFTRTEEPKHHWVDQTLTSGKHMLSLPVSEIEKGSYLLHVNVGEESFKQLVILQ